MSLQKQIYLHEIGLNLCEAALKSPSRHAEATQTLVTICEDLIRYTGEPAQDVFNAVVQHIDHKDCSHVAVKRARETIGLTLEMAA